MKTKNNSWKTTIAGYALIIAGIYIFITTKEWKESGLAITAGIGLLMAKDADKTGLPEK